MEISTLRYVRKNAVVALAVSRHSVFAGSAQVQPLLVAFVTELG